MDKEKNVTCNMVTKVTGHCFKNFKESAWKYCSKELYGHLALLGIICLNFGIFVTVSASKNVFVFGVISPTASSVIGPILIVCGASFMILSLIIYNKNRTCICCRHDYTEKLDYRYIYSEKNYNREIEQLEIDDFHMDPSWDEMFVQRNTPYMITGPCFDEKCNLCGRNRQLNRESFDVSCTQRYCCNCIRCCAIESCLSSC